MKKYKYMFIDAQILITTGVYALMHSSPGGKVRQSDLLRMFLLSTFKLIRECPCERPFLIWDSSPYHKNEILKKLLGKDDYKSDRGYKTESDIDRLKSTIAQAERKIEELKKEDPIINDSQISELQEQIVKWNNEITKIDVQIYNFQTRSSTKYYIIEQLQKFGLTSVIKKGWEADDIITLLSDWCHSNGHTAVIVSKDSDYDFMLNPSVDKYNHLSKKVPTKENPNPKLTTFADVSNYFWWVNRDFPNKKLYEVKALMDSVWGSHNALHKTVKPEYCKEGVFLIDALNKGEEAFEDYNLFKVQLETFDFTKYPDYKFISECLPWYSTKGTLGTSEEFVKFCKDNGIFIRPEKYIEIVNILNFELYNNE